MPNAFETVVEYVLARVASLVLARVRKEEREYCEAHGLAPPEDGEPEPIEVTVTPSQPQLPNIPEAPPAKRRGRPPKDPRPLEGPSNFQDHLEAINNGTPRRS